MRWQDPGFQAWADIPIMSENALPAAACIQRGQQASYTTIHLEEFQAGVGRFGEMCIDGDGGDPAAGMLVHTW